jgi:hypothetical protein
MRYPILFVALGALASSQVSAGELQSVYVAPGGIYIASGHIHVGTESGYPAYGPPQYHAPHPAPSVYAPPYVPPGHVYGAPTYYESYRSPYAAPAFVERSEYAYTYEEDLPPRPPAAVPYAHCASSQAYGWPSVCQ